MIARVDCAVSERSDPNTASGLIALHDTRSGCEQLSLVPSRGRIAGSDYSAYIDPNPSP